MNAPDDDRLRDFRASSYQRYQGHKLVARFDAYSYVVLTRAMDSHHLGRGRGGVAAALAGIRARTLVLGITSDVLFPLAWSGIEAGLATACYRLVRAGPSPARGRALGWLAVNIAMIGGWSQLFFRQRALSASTVAASALVATSAALVSEAKAVDRTAARAGMPLVAWVAFATVLTASIWRMNRR